MIKKLLVNSIPLFLLILLMCTSIGADSWPMEQQNAQHTGHTSSMVPLQAGVFLNTQVLEDEQLVGSPVYQDGSLFFCTDAGALYCLDAITAELQWSFESNAQYLQSPAILQDSVLMSGLYTNLVAFDKETQQPQWTASAKSITPLTVYDSHVYFSSLSEKVYCVNKTGDVQWIYNADGSIREAVSVDDDVVIAVTSDQNTVVHCLDQGTGQLIWTYEIDSTTEAAPVIFEEYVFIGSDTTLLCLEKQGEGDGTTTALWQESVPSFITDILIHPDKQLYVTSRSRTIRCFNTSEEYEEDNRELWTHQFSKGLHYASLGGSHLLLSTDKPALYCLYAFGNDQQETEILWEYDLDSKCSHQPIIADNKIWVLTDQGTLYGFFDTLTPPASLLGPTNGVIETQYTYQIQGDTAYTIDLEYIVDWGDGTSSGPVIQKQLSHIWSKPGSYDVKVKAIVTQGDTSIESAWSDPLIVSIHAADTTPTLSMILAPSTVVEGETFTVTIRDGSDAAVENAEVRFLQLTKYTDSTGKVFFTAPPVHQDSFFSLVANAEGYQSATKSVLVNHKSTEEQQGYLYGSIYDSTGLPVAGAYICFTDEYSTITCTYTNEDGSYVQALSPGIYQISASKPGYSNEKIELKSVQKQHAQEMNFILEQTGETPQSDEIERQIQQAKQAGNIGSEISIFKHNDQIDSSSIKYADVTISLVKVDDIEDIITLCINGSEEKGKTVLISIDKDIFTFEDILVNYDDVQIKAASSLSDILNPLDDGSLPEYYVVSENEIFVSIPHFSEHTVTISSQLSMLFSLTGLGVLLISTIIAVLLFSVPVHQLFFKKRE